MYKANVFHAVSWECSVLNVQAASTKVEREGRSSGSCDGDSSYFLNEPCLD